MLSSIFQNERFYSYGTVDDHSLENLVKQYGDEEAVEVAMDMDIDSYGRGKSSSADDTAHADYVAYGSEVEYTSLDNLYHDNTPQFCSCGDELKRVVSVKSPQKPFQILKKYASRCRRLNGENMTFASYERESQMIFSPSVETLIQLGAEKFIKSSSKVSDELSVLCHPYPSSILCHSGEDCEGVRLVETLLSCAEKVDKKQYEEACELLLECDRMSSATGSVIQRLVFYFAEGLYEKIDRETGQITPKGLGKKVEDPLIAVRSPDETTMAFHKELPISQITKFAGIQAVVDNVGEARKVHFIDFEIRKGIHCIILMQALVDRCGVPIECLRISAVCVGGEMRASVEATGRRLVSSAQSLGLSFSFDVVMVEDLLELNEKCFQIDREEVVSVYAEYTLTHMIGRPDRLEHVMKVMRSLSFRVMVVAEVETNCNSPIFVDRFVEALFFYGAYFESMADCVRNVEQRCIAEATCFGSSIRNVVATEGRERKIRHVRMSVWRSFFSRFGFEETELSMSSVYQANLVVKNFASGSFFTFGIDGKSLIIGWKGTPMSSISAWRFSVPDNYDNPM
ncbi:DELLA protein RGL1-like [Salvia miltiorrhiza]|uniref:DELLA protein RGL1-like n=1 Tax=Salvia miltiorrhiza TaxID=226208 RepID=UPI0025AC3C3E|nr:DELLA protein RGL1-like [Salvia miltiorrhiza]